MSVAKQTGRLLTALGAALLATCGVARADVVLDGEAMITVSAGADLCHDPAIAVGPNGAVAAWSAFIDGRNRIQIAARIRNEWTPPRFALDSGTADCREPIVAIDSNGSPALVWIEAETDSHVLKFSPVVSREDPQTVYSSGQGMIETPSLGFDGQGRPLVAWTEGNGASYSVALSRFDSDSNTWTKIPLTMRPEAYDILPTVFGGPQPTVHWYALDGQAFQMKSALIEERGWRSQSVGELDALPANRLPILYQTAPGLSPGAIWVEPQDDGELLLTYDPRRAEGDRVRGLPSQPAARQLEPDAVDGRTEPAYAWREETPQGSDLLVQSGPERLRVSGLEHVAQPRLAAGPNGELHLLFISDQIEGGTGQVYWTLLR
ncbi:hypothetical protein KQI84_15065 [bacterium]|nr:hypothetical protein [bacterium]